MQIPKLHAPRIIHDTMQEQKDIELSSYKSLDEVIRPRPSLSLCYGLYITEFCYFVFLLYRTLNFLFHLISWGRFTDPQLYWRLFEFACRLGISNIHMSVPPLLLLTLLWEVRMWFLPCGLPPGIRFDLECWRFLLCLRPITSAPGCVEPLFVFTLWGFPVRVSWRGSRDWDISEVKIQRQSLMWTCY